MEKPYRHPTWPTMGPLILIDLVLIVGVLVAAGVLFAMKQSQAEAQVLTTERRVPVISYVGAGYGAIALAMMVILPPVLDATARRRAAPANTSAERRSALWQGYFSRHVLLMAFLEGAALLSLVAYFIETQVISLPVIGVMIVMMALQVPSKDRVNRWLDGQERLIENQP